MNCMCYTIPILKTEEEFWADDSENSTESINEVKDVPENFKEWIRDNEGRIEKATDRGTLPYFIKDNREVVGDILNPEDDTPINTGAGDYNNQNIGDDGRKPLPKLREDFTENELQNFVRTLVGNEGWFVHSDKEVEVRFYEDKTAAASADRKEFCIYIKPKDAIIRALYKVSNGLELSYEECDSLGTLWHEITHLPAFGLFLWILPNCPLQ